MRLRIPDRSAPRRVPYRPRPGMRGVDRVLVVTSVLVILSLGALYLAIRATKI